MVLFNYSTRELTAKIVYYGPGLCGKTTNLQFIHENLPGEVRGKMLSLATKTDRTLFFDFLPIDLGEIRGLKTRVQLYTVPGQVFYNETRKLVLKGADGIVFVADSQDTMLGADVESFKNLEENLKAHGMKLSEMPHVIQFNKRDLPKLSSIEDLNAALNKYNAPFYESVATSGIGIQDTLKAIVKLVLLHLTKKYDPKSIPAAAKDMALPTPVPIAPPPVAAPPAAAPPAAAAAKSPAPKPARETSRPAAATPPPAPERRAAAPLAAHVETVIAAAPKPARPRKPVETMPPFGEEEIDGLVGEVEEFDPGPVAAPLAAPIAAPVPAMAAIPVSAPSEDEGIWLGSREEEPGSDVADTAMYGSSTSLEDLLAEPAVSPAIAEPEDDVRGAEWPPARSEFEVDRGFDPEWGTPAVHDAAPAPPAPPAASERMEDTRPSTPFPVPAATPPDGGVEEDVLLTEVASDDDLFVDPSLEIAHLVDGQTREIVVPVMLGEGASARRFKLGIRLRLDPVE
ncbi:MAG TPA: GTPase domain-containing protein [Candidatus Polarisedimenticolaceae bacterium]|nr:GTPase domain-containing protein [Candidatus Polarisedimenticolaceae bacterium]